MVGSSLSSETLNKFRSRFFADAKNVLAQNACTRSDPVEVCISRNQLQEINHVFTHKIDIEGKPITNQRSSGRCWIFACLNVMRIPITRVYNLEKFEFSQAHLFFWDKIERANFFLNTIVKTAKRGEPLDGRLVSFLLAEPTPDGGQWDMLVNLINRHGLMPKKCFPESYSCEASSQFNNILNSKLREFALILRAMARDAGASECDIAMKIEDQMYIIYRIVAICLGVPPQKFTWEYIDKQKKYCKIGPVSPQEFYQQHVAPHFNVDNKVCLVTDPRITSPYGMSYTIDCLGNMEDGRKIIYNNQPVELLMEVAANAIRNNEAVWFGCQVSKRFASKPGIEDIKIHDYKLVFGVDVSISMTKAERMVCGESMMTHAMALTGVSFDDNGVPIKWCVENSWGDDRGNKGFLVMTSDWFKEYVFEVVVDKVYVPQDVQNVFNTDPIILPPWDPMGMLAK